MSAGTITVNDGLDLLADFMGVGPQIEAITNKVSAETRSRSSLQGFGITVVGSLVHLVLQ